MSLSFILEIANTIQNLFMFLNVYSLLLLGNKTLEILKNGYLHQ
uniref:Uncharacterized protein n=1 Tax=Myoviridae sp. ctijX18 TaxID=2825154 RepID=A0A8S5USR9_9CAUD|nr:MAG TPA: hypothetical protein [Myoviridae sp. ctijX18]DAQ61242.1 MAG TPA: hypothetical protein [Caudoviricetes sp.]